jgi:hypothetical protein
MLQAKIKVIKITSTIHFRKSFITSTFKQMDFVGFSLFLIFDAREIVDFLNKNHENY